MVQRKRLKRWMKLLLERQGFDPEEFYYTKNLQGELHIVQGKTRETLVVEYRDTREVAV